MELEPPPGGFIIDDADLEPPPGGFIVDERDAVADHPSNGLGKALYEAIQHAMKSASPFQAGPVLKGTDALAVSGAPGAVAGMTGTPLPEDASIPSQVMRVAADPALMANLAAAAATGGASLPVQAGMAALTTGSGRALQEGIRQAAEGEDSTAQVLGEGGKAAAVAGSLQGLIGGAGKGIEALRPRLTKLGAQMLRVLGGTPEKYGEAVLKDPSILTRAETRLAAGETYKAAIGDLGGMREVLQGKSGKLLPPAQSVIDLVNDAAPKLADKTISLQEALAAKQAASHLLNLAKYGNPEQMANKAALVGFKNELDDLLERGLPGFAKANRGYFEANAKAAFDSLMPLNKNMSPNALRGLGLLAQVAGASLLETPKLLVTAGLASPKMQGLAIRGFAAGAEPAALAAKFAARLAAVRAAQSTAGGRKQSP